MPTYAEISPWHDSIVDQTGFDPRSDYVETFWLPTLGPTGLTLLRYVATQFEKQPKGFRVNVKEASRLLGLGERDGMGTPFMRTFERLCQFGLAVSGQSTDGSYLVAVRKLVPHINPRHVTRLPESLQCIHQAYIEGTPARQHLTDMRKHARRQAAALAAQGASSTEIEHCLLRAGFHPTISRESAKWADDELGVYSVSA